MHPRLDFSFFEIDLYSALVGLGMLAGLLSAYLYLRLCSRRASAAGTFLDGVLLLLAGGWVGARAYHVLMNWEYYQARPEEIAQVGLGGLGIRGAFVVGVVLAAGYTRWRRISFGHVADAAAIGLSVGQAIGWAGALAHGANYGIVSSSQFAVELPNLYGLVEPRFPVQHLEFALFALLFFALVGLAARRRAPGLLFLGYLLIASLANVLLGFQRGDETAYLGAVRLDQIVDLALGLSAASALAWRRLNARQAIARARVAL
ncbi:MAG: prolipoprotein diacylglyceryl transferase [Chloroflexi bacterium]|nr:prolipoprotein diacylglyceryl transferase [Chloroflexota bacterium]